MNTEERSKARIEFLKDLYTAFYEKNGTGIIVEVTGKDGKDKELIYQPLVDVGLVKMESSGMGKRKYTITANGIFKVEEIGNEKCNS